MFPVLSANCSPRKNVIVHICLSSVSSVFSPRAKIFSGRKVRKVKSLPEQLSLSGDNFISRKGAVDPSFCHDEFCNLFIIPGSARSAAGSCPRAWLIPSLWCMCPHVWVHWKISGTGHWCHGISMNGIVCHL